MNNQFNEEFPNDLHGKVAPEEFKITLSKVNAKLGNSMPMNLKWLICGCVCCCCTMGCSLWPVVYLSKRTRRDVSKIIDHENHRLYLRLGMRWSLSKQPSPDTNTMLEYVLRLDFIPKDTLNRPD